MIDGVGRMQPMAPAATEAGPREPLVRGSGVAGRMPAAVDGPADVSLRRIGAEMAARPPVDAERVAALREAIAAGTYRVDADAIADAMLRQAGA